MKKNILALAALLTATLVLSSCAPKKEVAPSPAPSTPPTAVAPEGSPAPAPATTGTFKVGFVSCNLNDTGQTYIADAAKEFALANGITFDLQDAADDVVKQQDLVRSLIQNKVDALVVVPVDTNAMKAITEDAIAAKIPLVYVNRNPFGENELPEGVYYVGSQEIVAGRLQAEYLEKALGGKGNIAILQGLLSNEGAIKRTEGNVEVLSKNPNFKILAKESADWQRDKGITVTENLLTAYGKDLNAILANNDEMALGAVQALAAANRTDVIVLGVDATPDAIKSVKEGKLVGTVLQDLAGQGKIGLETALKALNKENPEKTTWIEFKLVTPENVAEFE